MAAVWASICLAGSTVIFSVTSPTCTWGGVTSITAGGRAGAAAAVFAAAAGVAAADTAGDGLGTGLAPTAGAPDGPPDPGAAATQPPAITSAATAPLPHTAARLTRAASTLRNPGIYQVSRQAQ